MAKFHVNKAGDAGLCEAVKAGCPFGAVEDHFDTAEQAREAFEKSMSSEATSLKTSAKYKELPADVLITVLSSNGDVLTERTSEGFDDLPPGVYSAQYFDEHARRDVALEVYVTAGEPIKCRTSKSKAKTRPKMKSSPEIVAKFQVADVGYSQMNQNPIHCLKNGIDHATLIEASQAYARVRAKYDVSLLENVTKARLELEDIEWSIDSSIAAARKSGDVKALKAALAAKEPLKNLLDSLKTPA